MPALAAGRQSGSDLELTPFLHLLGVNPRPRCQEPNTLKPSNSTIFASGKTGYPVGAAPHVRGTVAGICEGCFCSARRVTTNEWRLIMVSGATSGRSREMG